MPSMDCPNCDGSGYTTDASGESVICPVCDGTGSLSDDEDTSDAVRDAGG
jgi:RecJ-like exonuclease